MNHLFRTAVSCAIIIGLTVGCATNEFTFRVVDEATGKPLKRVSVYQRNLRTRTPTDQQNVIWFYDTWHPFPTRDDGVFRCSLDDAHWHVLLFRDETCDGPKGSDHVEQFVTIPPDQSFVQIGDWPKEGKKVVPEGIVTVRMQTYSTYWAWLRSPLSPENQKFREALRSPQTMPTSTPATASRGR